MFGLLFIVGTVALAASPDASVQRTELQSGHYLVARPSDLKPHVPLPLIVCLHGTETSAADVLRFWRSLSAELPFIFVAPQGSRTGWRQSDLPLLHEMLDHVRGHVVFDPDRVLLTGHSAGGAMAFRMLYVEHFPATAVAVTANYLPPRITHAQVAARADVPVFYAVGTRDLNHARMRAGVALLRAAGVSITTRRPRIGHVLDRGVGQEALQWFERTCRDRVQARIEQARDNAALDTAPGVLTAELEAVLQYPQGHFRDQLPLVRDAVAQMEAPARRMLARAHELEGGRKYAEAHSLYMRVERDYEPASIATVAKACRLNLEDDPRAAADIAAPRGDQEARALLLWASIQEAMARSDARAAARWCRELLADYPRSIKADDARSVLAELNDLNEDHD